MSRLVHDENQTKNRRRRKDARPLPLTLDTIASHIRHCQSLTVDFAKYHFEKYQPALFEAFNLAVDNAKSNNEVAELTAFQRQFRLTWQQFEASYLDSISNNFVKFKDKKLGVEDDQSVLDFDSLSLVDNKVLEETITVTSMTTKLDAVLAEPLWALNQRLSLLNGGAKVVDKTNPASPVQFCEALRCAVRVVPNIDSTAVDVALKAFSDQLNELSKAVLQELNEYLIGVGILPNLKAGLNKPKTMREGVDTPVLGGSAINPAMNQETLSGFEQAAAESPQVYQLSLMNAIRGLQQQHMAVGGEQIVGVQPIGNNSVAVITVPQMSSALSNMQMAAVPVGRDGNLHNVAVAPTVGNIPMTMQTIQQQLAQQGHSGVIAQKDSNTLDFVGMLFEFMLKDDNIPDCVKAILSYLHTPFLKVAFADPQFFEQSDHPARILLNALADAGSRWVGNDGTAQYDVLNKIKDVVDQILRDYNSDISLFEQLLSEFEGFTKAIARRQELMEKRAAERAQGEQKLREVKIRVNEVIRERTAGQELPSPILLFLLQPWSDYMSFILLRHGDDSEAWKRGIGVVDDVIWAIQPQDDPEEVVMQGQLKDRMLANIEAGLETIGYDQVKGGRLIEAISGLVDLAVNAKKPEPAPDELRSQLEQMSAEKAGNHMVQLDAYTEEERKVVEHLKLIEYGTWFEFQDGKRLKVAWFNRRTMHYMLVDQMGKKVATMSGPELARDIVAHRARVLSGSSKPFFERALENIFKSLNEKEQRPLA